MQLPKMKNPLSTTRNPRNRRSPAIRHCSPPSRARHRPIAQRYRPPTRTTAALVVMAAAAWAVELVASPGHSRLRVAALHHSAELGRRPKRRQRWREQQERLLPRCPTPTVKALIFGSPANASKQCPQRWWIRLAWLRWTRRRRQRRRRMRMKRQLPWKVSWEPLLLSKLVPTCSAVSSSSSSSNTPSTIIIISVSLRRHIIAHWNAPGHRELLDVILSCRATSFSSTS